MARSSRPCAFIADSPDRLLARVLDGACRYFDSSEHLASHFLPTQQMPMKNLSQREQEVLNLCLEGLTNEGIAARLKLKVGTVNTYWMRIRTKAGGTARTDVVAKILRSQAESSFQALEAKNHDLAQLLTLALNQFCSAVWTTDAELRVQTMVDGISSQARTLLHWKPGATVQQIFGTEDDNDPVLSAHMQALGGVQCSQILSGGFSGMRLCVLPLRGESPGENVIGCMSILTHSG